MFYKFIGLIALVSALIMSASAQAARVTDNTTLIHSYHITQNVTTTLQSPDQ